MMINFAFGACRSAANAEAFITVYAGRGKCETGTEQGGVEYVTAVGGSDNDYSLIVTEAVHLNEQLV